MAVFNKPFVRKVALMDAIVIGAGLSGCVLARHLAESGKQVVILDRRDHIGGNMYDYVDEHGILIHKYGPHTFHTKQKELYEYMCKFARWQPYKLTCGAVIDGKYTPTPFNFTTIDTFYTKVEADDLKQRLQNSFPGREFATVTEVLNSSDETVSNYAQFLFDKDYSLYTAKQWGVPASEIDPSVLARVPLRFSYDEGYFDDEFQVMPETKYTDFFQNLINHENIEVKLQVEALAHLCIVDNIIKWDNEPYDGIVIYTGALDELFGLCYGKLPYRSLRFDWKYEAMESKQPAPVVAYPQAEGYTRITEYKKLPMQDVGGTTYAVEYPLKYKNAEVSEPYYPVLTEESLEKYAKYRELARDIKNLYCCGRLADFKYYNMDQALERALKLAKCLL